VGLSGEFGVQEVRVTPSGAFDNHARSYRHIEARPLAAAMGAEISGVDVRAAHITQHALTCRLRWEPDMLVLWDNRICLHHASNDYDGYRRELYRTTVQGEIPA
jgi:hypothetical protein